MNNPALLDLIGLILGVISALLMFFYPPAMTRYTEAGNKVVEWIDSDTGEGLSIAKRHKFFSRLAPILLLLAFVLQLWAKHF